MFFIYISLKVNLYKPHSRRTATRDIVEMFLKKKEALKNWLYTNQQRVSLTTDIWVSQVTGKVLSVLKSENNTRFAFVLMSLFFLYILHVQVTWL